MTTISRSFLPVILTWLFPLIAAAAAKPSPDQIVKEADKFRSPGGTYSFEVAVQDRSGDSDLRETTYKVYVKNDDLSLVETLTPARLKGRKLLMHGNDLWLYLPSIRRPTRVSFQQKLTGEVANGDIARTRFGEDYQAESLGDESVDGHHCYHLKLTARHKDVTYRGIEYWVEHGTYHPLKAVFQAISGKALKTGRYGGFAPQLGQPTLTELEITDELRPAQRSFLKYTHFRRETLSDGFFNKESLAE